MTPSYRIAMPVTGASARGRNGVIDHVRLWAALAIVWFHLDLFGASFALSALPVFLILVLMWATARLYYFAFYVLQHWVDPDYRFVSVWSCAAYLLRRARSRAPDGR